MSFDEKSSEVFKSAVALASPPLFSFFLFVALSLFGRLFFFVLIILGLFPFVSVVFLAKCIFVGTEVPVLFMPLVTQGHPHFPITFSRKGALHPNSFSLQKDVSDSEVYQKTKNNFLQTFTYL